MKQVTTQRDRDKAVIEAAVRKFAPLSRVELHELTRLRTSTISLIVRELLEEGRLSEVGVSNNPMGRKQILLRLNEEYGFIVGVEFDVENVIAVTMDLHPRIRSVVREPTTLTGGIEGIVEQLFACTKRAIDNAGVEGQRILGIGIANPGVANSRDGVSVASSTIEFWKDVPLKKMFEDKFGVPSLVENATRCKAVAERLLGAGDMADDMIYVEYGVGVGAGIIAGGKLLLGHQFYAGEFGHTHVIENGPACKCGSFGCLEALVGTAALEATLRKVLAEGSNSQALSMADGDANKINGWTVLKAAALGDKMCGSIVEQAGKYLGLGLANLVNLFNPSLIVLDQRLGLAGDTLLQQVKRMIKRQALEQSSQAVDFRIGTLGSEAGVLGSGLLILEKLFEIPVLKPPRFMTVPQSPIAWNLSVRRRERSSPQVPSETVTRTRLG